MAESLTLAAIRARFPSPSSQRDWASLPPDAYSVGGAILRGCQARLTMPMEEALLRFPEEPQLAAALMALNPALAGDAPGAALALTPAWEYAAAIIAANHRRDFDDAWEWAEEALGYTPSQGRRGWRSLCRSVASILIPPVLGLLFGVMVAHIAAPALSDFFLRVTAMYDTIRGAAPQAGEWWGFVNDPAENQKPQGPWPTVQPQRYGAPQLICVYVREVKAGWVRSYDSAAAPDVRNEAAAFVRAYTRITREACAGSQAAEGLRCPTGATFQGVGEDDQPRCVGARQTNGRWPTAQTPAPAMPLPQPGEWWIMTDESRQRIKTGPAKGPWDTPRPPPPPPPGYDPASPLCHYVRDVREGWVRSYFTTLYPDERDALSSFLGSFRRASAEECATSLAAAGLRCIRGTVLHGVDEEDQPICGPSL